ncbi:MAG: hypothetical protein ACRERC_07110 [Candidatus Binatia bacterium]
MSGTALMISAVGASADTSGCQQELVKRGQKYTSAITKALQKCGEAVLKGKIPGPCPDAKALDKINKAKSKFEDKVNDGCAGETVASIGFAGKVSRCVGGNGAGNRCVDIEDCSFPPLAVGPEDGVCTPQDECPTFLNGRLPGDDACEIALTSVADVTTCIECASRAKIDSLMGTFYGSLNALSDDSDIQKCQKDIGKRTAKYFDAIEKALAKCNVAVIKAGSGTCPDAKATDKIAKALAKLNDKLTSCADPATIGQAAQPAAIYGTAQRYGSCGVAGSGTTAGLASDLACLAENAADCDIALTLGNGVCSTPLCGNGQIDAGESCDDGNTTGDTGVGGADICPSDCTIAACAVSGTGTATVTIASPVALIDGLVLLTYNDTDLRIPGTGVQAPVLAAFTSGVFALNPRDLDYAARVQLSDPSFTGVPPGVAFTVTYEQCGAPATAADFGCMVVSATDAAFAAVPAASCSVSVP